MPLTLSDLYRWEQEKDIEKFVEILKYLYDDEFINVRILAVKALSRLRDPQALKYLFEATTDESDEVSECATKELIAWGTEDIDALCKFAENEKEEDRVRSKALRAISNIPCDRVITTYFRLLIKGDWVDTIRNIISRMTDIEPILSRLLDDNPEIRFTVIFALGEIYNNRGVIEGFIKALNDVDVQVRLVSVRGLYLQIYKLRDELGDKFDIRPYKIATEPLIRILKDQDYIVRARAASALGQIQDQCAIEPLLDLLEDPFENVRCNSVYALSKIPSDRTYKPLISLYKVEKSIKVRKDIIHAISVSSHEEAFAFIKNVVEDEKEFELRTQAIRETGTKMTDEAFKLLVKVIDEGNSDYVNIALSALEELNNPRSVDPLLKLLEKDDEQTNFKVLTQMFGKFKEKRAIELLIELLGKGRQLNCISWIIEIIVTILKPQTIDQYLESLPVPQTDFFNSGVQKIKNELQQTKDQTKKTS